MPEIMPSTKVATPENLQAHFRVAGQTVLTFLGYSAAEYEDKSEMIAAAKRVLEQFPAATTLVNIGGTADGVGAIYEIARRMGYATSGIVSTQASKNDVALSPWVDVVFYVQDDRWGGLVPGTGVLSPTSAATVECSDVVVAIGGDEIARDEMRAAKGAGKDVRFIPADMNHQIARDKALREGRPAPTTFRGAASTVS